MTPREAALDAAGICLRTEKLGEMNLPAVAPVIETIRYRTGCLIVAEWVPGSDLKTVADSGATLLDEAVAAAMLPLTDSMARARNKGVLLGLDNRHRMRVAGDGTVFLAFPAVLPDADEESDQSAYAFALELLAGSAETDSLAGIVDAAREEPNYREIEDRLAEIAKVDTFENTSPIPIVPDWETEEEPEDYPEVKTRGGFGERGLGTFGTAGLVAVAITAVVLVAALTVYMVSLFGNTENSPITNESARDGAAQVSESLEDVDKSALEGKLPVIIAPLTATAWGDGADTDRNTDFEALVDNKDDTAASTNPGEYVLLTPSGEQGTETFVPSEVIFTTVTGELDVTIYAIDEHTMDTTDVNHLRILANSTLKDGRTDIDIEGDPAASGLVISFSAPEGSSESEPSAAIVRGITVVGTRLR